ncbi:MAG: hypothetical protein R3F30_03440 [Planctomycetota bacterium]
MEDTRVSFLFEVVPTIWTRVEPRPFVVVRAETAEDAMQLGRSRLAELGVPGMPEDEVLANHAHHGAEDGETNVVASDRPGWLTPPVEGEPDLGGSHD